MNITTKVFCLIFFVCTSSHAEYRMILGLETSKGGNLPEDSIIFKNSSTNPTSPIETPAGDDYSIFGIYEAAARAIVANTNPVTKVTYDDVKDIFNAGYNLNDYRTLQNYGYGYGLVAAYIWKTNLGLTDLIALHTEGYNLIRLGQAANYVEATYSIPVYASVDKITKSYKASCWNTLDEAFMQINISQWDAYADQQNCLK